MHGRPVLRVEDTLDDQALVFRAVKKNQISLPMLVAGDTAEAMSYLLPDERRHGAQLTRMPLFVLLDLQLPTIGGLEVLRRIRTNARTAHLPVIILTSSHEERDRADSYRLGANSYVCKPADFTRFVAIFQQIVSYWSELNEQPPEPAPF